MSDNLNQIISTGSPQGSGASAKYVFTCISCGGQVVTPGEHSTGQQGLLGSALSSQAQYGLSSLLWRIPIIGSFLSSLASGAISQRQAQGQPERTEEAKKKAFEEVRGQFKQCTSCGAWACPACYSNGLCKACGMAAQGGGGQQGTPQGGQPGGADPTQMKF